MPKHTWSYEMDQRGLLKVLVRAWRICVYSLWCILKKIQAVLPEYFTTILFQSSVPGKWKTTEENLAFSLSCIFFIDLFIYFIFRIIRLLITTKLESSSTFLGGSVTDWVAWGKQVDTYSATHLCWVVISKQLQCLFTICSDFALPESLLD